MTVGGGSQALASRADVAAKLEELKRARKREKQMIFRGRSAPLYNDHNEDAQVDRHEKAKVVISWHHVERSLGSTRSSISSQERQRLAAIYREFVVGRNGEMPSGQGGTEVGGRSSLM